MVAPDRRGTTDNPPERKLGSLLTPHPHSLTTTAFKEAVAAPQANLTTSPAFRCKCGRDRRQVTDDLNSDAAPAVRSACEYLSIRFLALAHPQRHGEIPPPREQDATADAHGRARSTIRAHPRTCDDAARSAVASAHTRQPSLRALLPRRVVALVPSRGTLRTNTPLAYDIALTPNGGGIDCSRGGTMNVLWIVSF
jgi:hypothetical protein